MWVASLVGDHSSLLLVCHLPILALYPTGWGSLSNVPRPTALAMGHSRLFTPFHSLSVLRLLSAQKQNVACVLDWGRECRSSEVETSLPSHVSMYGKPQASHFTPGATTKAWTVSSALGGLPSPPDPLCAPAGSAQPEWHHMTLLSFSDSSSPTLCHPGSRL